MDEIILFLGAVLILASIEDVRSLRIPNWVTLPGMAVGLSYFGLTKGYEGFLFSLSGALTGGALLTIPYLSGGIGAGDVKLMGAVGSVLGAKAVFGILMLSFLFGGAFALLLLASQGLLTGACKRYGSLLWRLVRTRQWISLAPAAQEKALKVRFGVAIALGTGTYLVFGFSFLGCGR